MSNNQSIHPDFPAFDPGILPVYTCVKRLYLLCSGYVLSSGYIQWVFDSPDARASVGLQEVFASFNFFEVNYTYHVGSELFETKPKMFIECSVSHLWGKMFDCVRTDLVSEAVTPRRSSRQRSSQRYKVNSARR